MNSRGEKCRVNMGGCCVGNILAEWGWCCVAGLCRSCLSPSNRSLCLFLLFVRFWRFRWEEEEAVAAAVEEEEEEEEEEGRGGRKRRRVGHAGYANEGRMSSD